MHKTNTILIRAPLDGIFRAAAGLERWPEFLPHYRANVFLARMPWGGIVKMQARRGSLPTSWISVFQVDEQNRRLHFEHLKSALNATRGMRVMWRFEETAEGVRVSIDHELALHWPLVGGWVADAVVGRFFIEYIAARTLAGLKAHCEAGAEHAA